MKKFLRWLKNLYIIQPKQNSEVKTVSEQIVDPVVEQPAVVVPTPVVDPAPAVSEIDTILAKLKATLIFAGHDVEEVFDEAVALAKKL